MIPNKLNILADLDTSELLQLNDALTPKMTKYIPHDPTINPKQHAFLLLNNLESFYGGAAGGGKAQKLKSAIQTPFGPQTMGDMQLGSQVCNPDGNISRVIAIHPQGVKNIYKVSFTDDASTYVTEDHLWLVSFSGKPKKNIKYYIDTHEEVMGRICNTKYLMEHLERQKINNKYYYPLIPLTQPVRYTYPLNRYIAPLILHPYLIGVLLGDGCFTIHHNKISFSSVDEEIIHKVHSLGYTIKKIKNSITWVIEDIKDKIVKLDLNGCLANTKVIPDRYKYASIEDRKQLIQGLMDTDGYVDNRGHMSYTTISKQLAKDFRQVILSLGGKATITDRIPSYTYKEKKLNGQKAYTVYFNTPINPDLVSLSRKKQFTQYSFNGGASQLKRRMVSIEPAGQEECQCITIDHPNGLYLTDDFIVTHNSDALLMAALQYVDTPGYAAMLFRRTFQQLSLEDSLLDRAMKWLHPYRKTKEIHWSEKKHRYTFPSGSTLTFGHLEHENDKYNYDSAAFQFIGFDEVTQFTETQYTYLFSRLRKLADFNVPLRLRSASNPGGIGHEWVKRRFITFPELEDIITIPAFMEDNPELDRVAYEKSLEKLDPITKERLRWGNWDVKQEGAMFDRTWFKVIDKLPDIPLKKVRYWDKAATPKMTTNNPAYTAGVLIGEANGFFYIINVIRVRKTPYEIEKLIKTTAIWDGTNVDIWMEQEPGSSGKDVIDHYARTVLKSFHFRGKKETGSKESRAEKFSSAAQQGRVYVLKGAWNEDYFDELEVFPNGRFKDQTDASSGAYNKLQDVARYDQYPIEVGKGSSYWKSA